jgi:hypothetical protein
MLYSEGSPGVPCIGVQEEDSEKGEEQATQSDQSGINSF